MCKAYFVLLKPQNCIIKLRFTATWVPCLLFSLSALPGCQHRQVCILRLPLLPQLEMGYFLCYIVAVWYITAPSWKPPIWIFQLVGIIVHRTASLQGGKNALVKRCKMTFECEESKKEALIILLWWLLSLDMNCLHCPWASWLQSG